MAKKDPISPEAAQRILLELSAMTDYFRKKAAIEAGFESYKFYKIYLNDCISNKKEEPTTEEPQPEKDTFIGTEPCGDLTDMVIAFDSTGSMRSYLHAVRTYVKDLIPKLLSANPNLQISIVVFGDYDDMIDVKNHKFGKAYQVIGLTRNENDLIDFVINARDTSGGDAPEFYELVLRKVRTETQWRPTAQKSMLLIADYEPHNKSYYSGGYGKAFANGEFIDWELEALQMAEDGIKVDTLQIRLQEKWYAELSKITGGINLPFNAGDIQQTSDLVEMTAYARGGDMTRSAFMNMSTSNAVVKGSTAVRATYDMFKEFVDEDMATRGK